jgi:hypothetical protein
MTNEQLLAELASSLKATAQSLLRLAVVWCELERRGVDLDDFRCNLTRHLPMIASGVLSPDAVIAFSGRPRLLSRVASLPVEKQIALARGEEVSVAVPGEESIISLKVSQIPNSRLGIVFGDGVIRTPKQQRLAIGEIIRGRKKKVDDGSRVYRPKYDPDEGTVKVGAMTVKASEVIGAMSSARGPDKVIPSDVPESYVVVRVRLLREEYDALQNAAKKAELPDWELIRKAARAFGLI